MITAQLISPWAETQPPAAGRHPKIADDFPLESCRTAEVAQSPPGQKIPVIVRCTHQVWEKIIQHPEYGPVYWYQEDGRQKRILR